MAELEKLGPKYRIALRYIFVKNIYDIKKFDVKLYLFFFVPKTRVARDPRFERLPCMHKGTYADDCLVQRVSQVIIKIANYFIF